MNKGSIHTTLALALTFATLTAAPVAVLAADHSSHGSGHGSVQATEQKAQVYTATGTVTSVDKAAGKATITHDPVPALGWPAMTMGFKLADPRLAAGLAPKQQVRFTFSKQGEDYVITAIERAKP